MNKIVNRVYYALMTALVVLIITIVATGCSDSSGDVFDTPDYVYYPEVLPLSMPDGVDWIGNLTVVEDSIFFTAYVYGDEDNPGNFNEIYSMDLDNSSMKMLPNYNVASEFPPDADEGAIHINFMVVDGAGNIWVVERGEFYNLPEDYDGDWEQWNKREIIKEFTRVRKLDNTGAELLSIDVTHLLSGQDWFHIQAFTVDDEGNIYLGADSTIYILDSEGRPVFNVDVQWVERLLNMQDGSVAHLGWGMNGRTIAKIDVAGKKLGEAINMPNNASEVYPGNDDYSLIFTDGIGLYGIETTTGEEVMLLKWIDSDLMQDGLGNIKLLPDGRILATSQVWGNEGPTHEVLFLTKTPYSELPERTILTMATFHLDWNIRSVIVRFNRLSTTHRIHVIDYAEFSTDEDWNAGLTRLSTEITAGNIPDILDVSNLPFNQYAAKGMLMDLYPLIDADADLNRNDFIESVLRATEINGSLYRIFPQFSVVTMLGNPAIVGDYPGWNMDEFTAVLNSNPKADYPLGQGLTKMAYLQALFMFNMDEYVDWAEGKVNFESDEFIALLEFANTLIDEFDWENEYVEEHALIAAGRQIIAATNMNDFDTLQMYRAFFGGDIVFKGLPAKERNGFSLMTQTDFAITTKCKDIDGAWEFLKTFLDEGWQKENSWRGMPVIKSVFDDLIEESMRENEHGGGSMHWDGFSVELKPLTQADVDKIMSVIDSVSGSVGQDDALWNIISEGAADFFNGRSSAQDAARIIQNRASTYVAEQR